MAARAIRLSDLGLTARAGRDPALSGLTVDSRAVRAGMLFAALPGTQVHGARFIPAALEQGASAVLTDAVRRNMTLHDESTCAALADAVRALAARLECPPEQPAEQLQRKILERQRWAMEQF